MSLGNVNRRSPRPPKALQINDLQGFSLANFWQAQIRLARPYFKNRDYAHEALGMTP